MDYRYRKNSDRQKPEQKLPKTDQTSNCRKARLKALKILERMDRTEAQLREKLLQAEFSPELVEDAIAYVKSYGYIDDERYVRNYIEYRREQKSRRQLEQELQYRKGVPQELIQKVYEDLEPADEKPLIRRFLEKKGYRPEITDEKTRQKLIAALLRKGFRMGDVLAVLRETDGWP